MTVLTPQINLYLSAVRTATPTVATFNSDGYHGLRIIIDITASSGTPSVTPTIDSYDSLSGKWYTILTGAAITGTGTTILKIYPGIAVVANFSASDVLDGLTRLVMTHATADSITYTAAAHLIG